MTKIVCVVIAAVCVCSVLPRDVKAADVSVGGTVWVSEWDSFLSDAISKSFIKNSSSVASSDVSLDPGFVAGPVASLRLSDSWTWANTILLGKFNGTAKATYVDGTSSRDDISVWRGDWDSTLNYSLNSYVRLFGGVKCAYLSCDGSSLGNPLDMTMKGAGPGAGFSLTCPITDNLFGIFNLSGLYLRELYKYPNDDPRFDKKLWFNVFGGNTTLSLGYYFPSLSLTASLGGRYQYLKFYSADDIYDGAADKFYGLVFSLIYTF